MAPFVIDPGGRQDTQAIPLATRKRWHIPNEQRRPRPPEAMKAALELVRKQFDASRVELRALDSTYNCVGLVFAGRRTCVDPDHVERILREDALERCPTVDRAAVGDVAVYRVDNEVSHVGVVAEVHHDLLGGPTRLRILSQWGSDGEYLHDADAVPPQLGRLHEVWSFRLGASS